ncbi:hypothetical protein B0A50_05247 [Salinomyces thailandicus]|uniref:PQ loop repeat protein n=1 Tax=Salinomyces thailandicus TaxID=706561 RepID=A0A4U0TYD4_9PEZI|nr:hypothetical protein B0A50_05247 [Salinomyces thailandica]
MDNATISNVFGTLGAICWSVQLIPQIIFNWRRHSAEGLSSSFMMFWAWAGVPLGVYNIVSGFNIALQVQPQILTTLSLITWIQCYYYQHQWSFFKASVLVIPVAAMMGGIEAGLVFALREGIENSVEWPLKLMAALAALFLALGVTEQYLAIWKHRSVEGISFIFCGIDALGDITSIISVVFEKRLNITGLVIYSVELVLWIGIFACGGYLKLLPLVKGVLHRDSADSGQPAQEDPSSVDNSIALDSLPSSTSVFRTASADVELRSRVAPASSNDLAV